MKYPTISAGQCRTVAIALQSNVEVDITKETAWEGRGEELDLDPIVELGATVATALEGFQSDGTKDRDLLEGRLAANVHATLRDFPVEVLDDPGFWRWLTLGFFWEFVSWREEKTFAAGEYEKYRIYVDGTNYSECVLMRMFLRGQVVVIEDDYALTSAVPEATDFWRSHVIRVRAGGTPAIGKAFVRAQAARRMMTDDLRPYARRLNRVQTNVVLALYDDDAARALIEELRES